MSNIYDNWERLVEAVIRREQLWQMFHDQSPSDSSITSDISFNSQVLDVPFDFSSPGGSSQYQQLPSPAGFSPVFDLEDMLRSSGKFLGMGTFGSAYMSAMDNGITVMLKRLNEVNISKKKFRKHMEVIGNIRHDNYGCMSDLGLASMIPSPIMRNAGYHASEVTSTQNVSQAFDVYSFGILLLELLTRKSPLHAIGGNEAVDLVKLVNSVNAKEQTANVFDVELLRDRNIEEKW
ncbi:unnamed protein product [Fraxinus pennsylvanica]|uniref:Serine-threonine/tyrosine-protein kinase catalytic domain-containing protein n=1 Tax=Fraxinus pennsylvanica TaxID=56036 RepID=A0AAD1ZJ40_9LAMI|nr:unnamed protein product [Fraxinus pennsylvanica]